MTTSISKIRSRATDTPEGDSGNHPAVPHHRPSGILQFWEQYQPAAGLLAVLDGLPAEASMTRRAILRKNLCAKVTDKPGQFSDPFVSHFPDYVEDGEFDKYLNSSIPKSMESYIFGNLAHPLAGRVMEKVRNEWDEPSYEGDWSGTWTAWRLFYRTGLVGFPLASRLVWLVAHANYEASRLVALIVRLRMERLGNRLASRAAALAVLSDLAWLLSMLATLGLGQVEAEAEAESPPRPQPRAPGVDCFGLFAPRC